MNNITKSVIGMGALVSAILISSPAWAQRDYSQQSDTDRSYGTTSSGQSWQTDRQQQVGSQQNLTASQRQELQQRLRRAGLDQNEIQRLERQSFDPNQVEQQVQQSLQNRGYDRQDAREEAQELARWLRQQTGQSQYGQSQYQGPQTSQSWSQGQQNLSYSQQQQLEQRLRQVGLTQTEVQSLQRQGFDPNQVEQEVQQSMQNRGYDREKAREYAQDLSQWLRQQTGNQQQQFGRQQDAWGTFPESQRGAQQYSEAGWREEQQIRQELRRVGLNQQEIQQLEQQGFQRQQVERQVEQALQRDARQQARQIADRINQIKQGGQRDFDSYQSRDRGYRED